MRTTYGRTLFESFVDFESILQLPSTLPPFLRALHEVLDTASNTEIN